VKEKPRALSRKRSREHLPERETESTYLEEKLRAPNVRRSPEYPAQEETERVQPKFGRFVKELILSALF